MYLCTRSISKKSYRNKIHYKDAGKLFCLFALPDLVFKKVKLNDKLNCIPNYINM